MFPRHLGGLDLHCAHLSDLCYMGILSNWHLIFSLILLNKYSCNTPVLKIKKPPSSSWGWKSIVKGLDAVKPYSKWNLGNGSSIQLWTNIWMGSQPLIHLTTHLLPLSHHFHYWLFLWLYLFLLEICFFIQFLPTDIIHYLTPFLLWQDHLVPTSKSKLTFKSLYHTFSDLSLILSPSFEKPVIPYKIEQFVWLCFHNFLLLSSVLFSHHTSPTNLCPCCQQSETIKHFLWDCS